MPRLYLLDHSLDVPGGHHFDFALNVGTSAEKAGWEVVIGANCRYAKTRGLPRNWLHLAAFRYTGYTRFYTTETFEGKRVQKFVFKGVGAASGPTMSVR